MEIYTFSSYKQYVLERVQAMPRKGHGQFIKIARHIGVSPVIVTQVLKGVRNFSDEQALQLAGYLGLQPAETEYFMRLLAHEKAGTQDLKRFHQEAIEALRKRAQEVKARVPHHQDLDEAAKSIFYSDWTYSAVRLLTSIPSFKTVEALAESIGSSRARTGEIVDFLLQVGLCKRNEAGQLELGIANTHVDAQSRFVNNHRRNWRLKALEALNGATAEELFFVAPCTLSDEDFKVIKSELLAIISSLSKRIRETNPESLVCLNIDWFKV